MLKNYTCLWGLHQLTSEEMYVLEGNRRNSKQTQSTFYTARFLQRDASRENASLASNNLLTSLQGSNDLGLHVVEPSDDKQRLKIEITSILIVCCSSQRVSLSSQFAAQYRISKDWTCDPCSVSKTQQSP